MAGLCSGKVNGSLIMSRVPQLFDEEDPYQLLYNYKTAVKA